MIPVLTKDQAYTLDKDTIKSGYVSQEDLMDNAGKAVAQFFCEKIQNPFSKKVLIICGKGNNGGDGVVTHSYLKGFNVTSKIVFTESVDSHQKLLKKYKIYNDEYSTYNDQIEFERYDWIIDGIFGIGLQGEVSGKYLKIFNKVNKNKNIISIDISSGLSADCDRYKNIIKSKHVITFGYPKLGHYLNDLENIHISDINFNKTKNNNFQKVNKYDVSKIIQPLKKKNNIHKYSKGTTTIVAGSDIYPGAAILCSRAAFVSGSGYVKLFVSSDDAKLVKKIDIEIPEVIVKRLSNNCTKLLDDSSCCIGPGLTKSMENLKIYNNHMSYIIDAGGFLSFKTIKDFPRYSIITPHIKEFQDIFNLSHSFISCDLFKKIQKQLNDKILILKSFNIFIITKDMIYIVDKGPSTLATAGTGDVLSGILVSLLSQGYSRLETSIIGPYLHAEAANYYMNNISKDGMTASDLIDCIPHAFNKLRSE